MVQEYGLFIGGKWKKSEGKRFETRNPATGEVLATFPPRDEGGSQRRGPRGQGCLRKVAEDARAPPRGAAPRGRPDLPPEEGGSWSDRHDGNGKSHRRGPGRRPGSDRFL